MRAEAEAWWKEALESLRAAEHLLKAGFYNYAAFHSHQAAEKALKTLIIERLRVSPPKTHNLLTLSEALKGVVDLGEVLDDLKDLNPHYLVSRYPDAANGVPSEVYSKRMAEACLSMARGVVEWAKRLLNA